jgi:hypothetical protein
LVIKAASGHAVSVRTTRKQGNKMTIANIPDSEYFPMVMASKSMLWKMYTQTPAAASHGFGPATDAMTLGSACHVAVLEPHEFDKRVVRGPATRRGKVWTEAKEQAEADGAFLLTEADHNTCQEMRDAVHANNEANRLILGNDAQVEHAALWNEKDVKCKSKIDLYRPTLNTVVDFKTARSAGPDEFAKSCANFGYHLQDFMYSRGWEKAGGGKVNSFIFIVVEKDPPYLTALYELDATAKAEGQAIYKECIKMYRQCTNEDEWPGYPEAVQQLSLPNWAVTKTDPTEMLGA